MAINKYEASISYLTDGEGYWERMVGSDQCPCEWSDSEECQGVRGHVGPHWCYEPSGTYMCWENENDPDNDMAEYPLAYIPPGHKKYISPVDKAQEYYANSSVRSIITDEALIKLLEQGVTPEENASITSPVSQEEMRCLYPSDK